MVPPCACGPELYKKADWVSYGEHTTMLHGLCFSSCLRFLFEFLPCLPSMRDCDLSIRWNTLSLLGGHGICHNHRYVSRTPASVLSLDLGIWIFTLWGSLLSFADFIKSLQFVIPNTLWLSAAGLHFRYTLKIFMCVCVLSLAIMPVIFSYCYEMNCRRVR